MSGDNTVFTLTLYKGVFIMFLDIIDNPKNIVLTKVVFITGDKTKCKLHFKQFDSDNTIVITGCSPVVGNTGYLGSFIGALILAPLDLNLNIHKFNHCVDVLSVVLPIAATIGNNVKILFKSNI